MCIEYALYFTDLIHRQVNEVKTAPKTYIDMKQKAEILNFFSWKMTKLLVR